MNRNAIISSIEQIVRQNLEDYDSGHDWWHIERVRKLALYINKREELADPFEVDITALMHDMADSKFAGINPRQGYQTIAEIIVKHGLSGIKDKVLDVIKNISFSSRNKSERPVNPLLWVVQDADRLDAIGAIGIARAFTYGGFRNNKIYDPDTIDAEALSTGNNLSGNPSTIRHFYEKLLLLKDLMNTPTARKLADKRHEFLEVFLKQFYKEWNFVF